MYIDFKKEFIEKDVDPRIVRDKMLDELKEKIADRITGQLRTWLPFVDIDTLNILTVIDDSSIPENCIKIKIAFSLNSRPDMTRTLEVII